MKHGKQKTRQKTDGGKTNEKAKGFHTGGTVTGRLTRLLPEPQEALWPGGFPYQNDALSRLRREGPPISVMVTMDLCDLERRIMRTLLDKTIIQDLIGRAVTRLRDQIDEEGCGAVLAALSYPLVPNDKDGHKI